MPLALFVHEAANKPTPGEAIFARAVEAAERATRADYATYDVHVRFLNGTQRVSDTWSTTEDIAHGTVIADVFSQEERRKPTSADGPNVTIGLSIQPAASRAVGASGDDASTTMHVNVASLNPDRTGDPIGPVAFAVDQNFGLTPPRTYVVVHDVSSFAASGSGLAVIGTTATQLDRYRVALIDEAGGVDHLGLTPLRDPAHNRLRELWVEDATATVREAIVAGIGDRAPLDRVRWDVTFAQDGGATYVADERALAPVDYGRGGRLRDVRITFDQLALLATSPFRFTFGIATPVQTVHDP
jgi:hypothetical protein